MFLNIYNINYLIIYIKLLFSLDTFVKNSHLLSNLNGINSQHSNQSDTESPSKNHIHNSKNHQMIQNSSHSSFKSSTSTSNSNELAATTVLLPPIDMSIEEQRALGYMPLRDDFEREYKNDSEVLLSNLTIANNQLIYLNNKLDINTYLLNSNLNANNNNGDANEDLIDFEFKLTLIQMYRECLMERERYKKIARDYGLINNASALINNHYRNLNLPNPNMPPNTNLLNCSLNGVATNGVLNNFSNGLSLNGNNLNGNINGNTNGDGRGRWRRKFLTIENDREMSELNEKLKKYAQFLNVTDYENLLENLRKQRQLFKRIQELQYYRSELGLTKIKEIEKYNREKERIDEEKRQARKEKKARKLSRHLETPKRVTRGQHYQIEQQKKYEMMMKRKKKLAEKNNNNNISDTPSKNTSNKRFKSEQNDELNTLSNGVGETNLIKRSSRSNSSNSIDIIPKRGRRKKNRVIDSEDEEQHKNNQVKNDDQNDEELEEEDEDEDSSDDGYLYDLNDENEEGEEYETSDQEDDDNEYSEDEDVNSSNTNSEVENESEEDEEMDEDDESLEDSSNDEDDCEDEDEEEAEEDDDEEEEDMSSAGAASSGGSGINEIKSTPSKRLLMRSDSSNSRLRKSLSSNENNNETSKRSRITYMLNEDSFLKSNGFNGKKKILNNSNSNNINHNNHGETNGSSTNKKISSKNRIRNQSKSLILKQKNKKKNKTSRRSERLCSMSGYNLLSENEKKVKGFIF